MKYKLNLKVLRPGDIILVGYNDSRSREIQKRTNSKYSHAMLLGDGCIIHASDIVITENPSRQLFEEDEAVCVMRLEPESWFEIRIANVISYAKNLVGTLYDQDALYAMRDGKEVTANPNRQMCAKFVAQCYQEAGYIPIHENVDLCTPEDLSKADDFVTVENPIVVANDWDIDYANRKPDVTYEQFRSLKSFLIRMLIKYPKADIMNLMQLEHFIESNPEVNTEVLEELQRTKYFDLWKNESEYCPFLYDVKLFLEFWKTDSQEKAFEVIRESKKIISDRSSMLQYYDEKIRTIGDLAYYKAMKDLQNNIISKANERIAVAQNALAFLGIYEMRLSINNI